MQSLRREWKFLAVFLFFLYLFVDGASFTVFQWRNPKANNSTYITYFWSVHTFKRVPAFQD